MALYSRHTNLSESQLKWIADKVVEKRIFTSGRKCWCTHCGQEFTDRLESEIAVCPHCGAEAKVEHGRRTTYRDCYYTQFFHIVKGWQVIRYSLVRWDCKKGREPRIEVMDVIQKWCQPGRPMITLGTALGILPYWRAIPYSLYGEPLTVRLNHSPWYSEWMKVKTYPRMSLLPVYRKHLGSRPDFNRLGFYAPSLLGDIFGCPLLERLWKEGKRKELEEMWHYTDDLNKYWPSVKIALRHGFKPQHWISYFDYLKALKFLRYDMRSPRYVAPPDWYDIHDLVMRQYRNKIEMMEGRRNEARRLRYAFEEEEARRKREEDAKSFATSFAKRKAKFLDLQIEDSDIVIIPLDSIEAFREEGREMHHCVFNMGYYKKENSLILSARSKADGERMETIEVDLQNWSIRQSQGKYNVPSDRHEEIVSLVNGAMPQIKRLSASRS